MPLIKLLSANEKKKQTNRVNRRLAKGIAKSNPLVAIKIVLKTFVEYEETTKDNVQWGGVYLDNAYKVLEEQITPKQWAGYLSQLAQQGDYKPEDGHFGMVKIK
jgi:hypothetical protein